MRHALAAWAGFGVILLLVVLARVWGEPPGVVHGDAPLHEPSAERAVRTLDRLIGGVGPHALGTEGAREVESRLMAELRALGVQPQVTPRVVCIANTCTRVRNVVAVLPGRDPSLPHLVVNSHYDSVYAGPGYGDDGSGMAAALEVLRGLQHRQPLARDVVFLWNEGEEQGLWGARAFVAHSPHAKNVHAVINVEARGVGGPSYLFEMVGETSGLAQGYARAARAPAGSSLYVAIYRMLPNGTDLSVFKTAGVPGVNLAFLGGGTHYHTPLDDAAHLDPRSVQHHADQLLGLLNGLDQTALDAPSGDRSFFDVYGLFVLTWGTGYTLFMALAALLVALGGTAVTVAQGEPLRRGGAVVLGVVGCLALPTMAAGWGYGVEGALDALGGIWHTAPERFVAGLSVGVLALGVGLALLLARLGRDLVWAAVALVQAGLAVALAVFLPEGAFLALVPAGGACIALACRVLRPQSLPIQGAGDLVGSLCNLVWVHLALSLPSALGELGLVVAGPLGIAGISLLPWWSPWTRHARTGQTRAMVLACAVLGAVSIGLLGSILLLPTATPDRPQGLMVRSVSHPHHTRILARNATWPRPGPLPDGWTADTSIPPPPGGSVTAVDLLPSAPGATSMRLRIPHDAHHVEIDLRSTSITIEGAPVQGGKVVWLGRAPNGLRLSVADDLSDPIQVAHTRTGLPMGAPPLPEGWVPIHSGFLHTQVDTLTLPEALALPDR